MATAKRLNKKQIKIAKDKAPRSIDTKLNPGSLSSNQEVIYRINTQPFASKRFVAKVLNKIFHIPLYIYKKSVSEYLTRQSITDTQLLIDSSIIRDQTSITRDQTSIIGERTSEILHRIESIKNDSASIMDVKVYEMMKLVDMMKSELMAEINKDQSPLGTQQKITTKWLSTAKKDSVRKLNLGSGSHILEDYINVDHREIEGVDLVCDIKELPFKERTIDEIFCAHVLEHFTEFHAKKLLKHWYSLLSEKGNMKIIVPDINTMAKQYGSGELSWDRLRRVILGGQDYNSDYHFNMFSAEYLENLLNQTLPNAKVKITATGRLNGEALELEVVVKR